jgi:Aerobic-type carbon monoxide dehydrogenase, large subunit CoxL/CutL homologs
MKPLARISLPEHEALYNGERVECINDDFDLSRRLFVKGLGAGLLLAVSSPALTQESGRRSQGGFLGSGARTVAARIHLGNDGIITVLAGKVEGGQGARAELSQAAAEELDVPVNQVQMILADTSLVPDDGMTAGSGTTPRTVPAVRQGAAAARKLLIDVACMQWETVRTAVTMRDGKVVDTANRRSFSYADLAKNPETAKLFQQAIPSNIELTAVNNWKVLGTPVLRPNAGSIVIGAHKYPSDVARPGMLYGKILRAPAYGAKLVSVDLAMAKSMKDVTVVQDGSFVGVAAPNSFSCEI